MKTAACHQTSPLGNLVAIAQFAETSPPLPCFSFFIVCRGILCTDRFKGPVLVLSLREGVHIPYGPKENLQACRGVGEVFCPLSGLARV